MTVRLVSVAPTRRPIVQVAAPPPGGVRDYVARLEAVWRQDRHADTLLVSGPRDLTVASIASGADVILHMSIYGYARRGLCGWLPEDVAELKRRRPDVRVTVVFHELYAFGPPWRSAFWTHIPQRLIIERLARLADRIVTNSENHLTRLGRMTSMPILLRPVFSNVGEPSRRTPTAERRPSIVVFGSEPTRARALKNAADILASTSLEVVEVGSGNRVLEPASNSLWLGALPAEALSEVLSERLYGLFGQDMSYAQKSSVFAAYAAHGCVPIVASRRAFVSGLTENEHFLASDRTARVIDIDRLDKVSRNIFRWYRNHTVQQQAEDFATYLEAVEPGPNTNSQSESREV